MRCSAALRSRRPQRRAQTTGLLCALVLIGLLSTLNAAEARAQGPVIVEDETLRERVEKMVDKLVYPYGVLTVEQILLLRKYLGYLEKLSWLFSRGVAPEDIMTAVRDALGDPALLGPTHPDLGQVFRETFPGYDVPTGGFEGRYIERSKRLMRTYRQILGATRTLSQQARTSDVGLKALFETLENKADTPQRVKDLALQFDARTAQEMLLLRQTLALETTLRALAGAARANRRSVARAALERALGMGAP